MTRRPGRSRLVDLALVAMAVWTGIMLGDLATSRAVAQAEGASRRTMLDEGSSAPDRRRQGAHMTACVTCHAKGERTDGFSRPLALSTARVTVTPWPRLLRLRGGVGGPP